MNEKNTNYLLKKYPKLYRQYYLPMNQTCMCWGFDCGDGWFKLLDKLSKQIVKLDPKCEAVQVKEKWGGLRFYVNATLHIIHTLIMNAEKESYTICEVCGKSGKFRGDLFWKQTLCKKHYNEKNNTSPPVKPKTSSRSPGYSAESIDGVGFGEGDIK